MKYLPYQKLTNHFGAPIKITIKADEDPVELDTVNVIASILQTSNYRSGKEILQSSTLLAKDLKEVDGHVALEDADFEFIKEHLETNPVFVGMKLNAATTYQLFENPISTINK